MNADRGSEKKGTGVCRAVHTWEGAVRYRMSVLLMIVILAGCFPRYAPLEGSGGSGSLDTIRAKILVAIAMRDYQHARELLELAEGFTQEERERLGWMITAAERGLVPFLEKALPHIFRPEDGHFERDTAQARELIQTTVTDANFVGVREGGSAVYQRIIDAGTQIWVYVYKGTIRDAGFNEVPRSAQELLKGR